MNEYTVVLKLYRGMHIALAIGCTLKGKLCNSFCDMLFDLLLWDLASEGGAWSKVGQKWN